VHGGLIALLIFATYLWQFYVVLVLLSLVSIFFMPAQSVAIRTTVPREGLLSTDALMQQVFFFMRIAGPQRPGLLVASFGSGLAGIAAGLLLLAATAKSRSRSSLR
jgi:hypothetical protein